MKMKKKSLRFVAVVLAVTMLISSNSVFATTTAEYDEQIESIKSQQAENEAEAERLNEKLDSLRDQTSELQRGDYKLLDTWKKQQYQKAISILQE